MTPSTCGTLSSQLGQFTPRPNLHACTQLAADPSSQQLPARCLLHALQAPLLPTVLAQYQASPKSSECVNSGVQFCIDGQS